MAIALEMDASQFTRLLKWSTRLGPHGYVTKRRIDRAKDLLRHADLSLVDIALAVGFSSQSHFTATFRRHTGMTPGAFRRQLSST
ncbi:MAG: helix-turn-helix transcriptional regulator [Chloroflexi bacterium]|nr:helix-turn-helix transcriptional regulator [Chloroflexota bacterium]